MILAIIPSRAGSKRLPGKIDRAKSPKESTCGAFRNQGLDIEQVR
jgi:hypothetical protein